MWWLEVMKRGIESDVFEEETSTNSTGEREELTLIITATAFRDRKRLVLFDCMLSQCPRGMCVSVCACACVSDTRQIDHTVSKKE